MQVVSYLKEKENLEVSASTIRRILREHSLVSGIKRKKPFLSASYQKAWLDFCKKHEGWTVEDWSKVIWSDESRFQIFGSNGKQYY